MYVMAPQPCSLPASFRCVASAASILLTMLNNVPACTLLPCGCRCAMGARAARRLEPVLSLRAVRFAKCLGPVVETVMSEAASHAGVGYFCKQMDSSDFLRSLSSRVVDTDLAFHKVAFWHGTGAWLSFSVLSAQRNRFLSQPLLDQPVPARSTRNGALRGKTWDS